MNIKKPLCRSSTLFISKIFSIECGKRFGDCICDVEFCLNFIYINLLYTNFSVVNEKIL